MVLAQETVSSLASCKQRAIFLLIRPWNPRPIYYFFPLKPAAGWFEVAFCKDDYEN